MKHRRETHPAFRDGCFGCRISGIAFSSVPGGTKAGSANLAVEKDFAKGLDGYKNAKNNGLQPNAPTVRAVRVAEAKAEAQGLHMEMVANG